MCPCPDSRHTRLIKESLSDEPCCSVIAMWIWYIETATTAGMQMFSEKGQVVKSEKRRVYCTTGRKKVEFFSLATDLVTQCPQIDKPGNRKPDSSTTSNSEPGAVKLLQSPSTVNSVSTGENVGIPERCSRSQIILSSRLTSETMSQRIVFCQNSGN